MVDVEGGNNMLYLPLDKIAQGSGSSPRFSEDQIRQLTDRVVREANSRSASSRGRDGR